MEQQIRFCTTLEGVHLAYAILGHGSPLVAPPGWISNLKLHWEDPRTRAFIEALSAHHTVVRYDKHGCGLSDRDRKEFSIEKEVKDLETVVDHIGLQRFALFGMSEGGPISIAYTGKYAQRISHLILYGSYARGRSVSKPEIRSSLCTLIRAHWGMGSQTLADLFVPGASKDDLEAFARSQRESASAEMAARLLEADEEWDVTDLLPRITAPTLVIHREKDRAVPARCGRELAALIPNAHFIPLEGNDHMPTLGDSGVILRAIADFLEADAEPGESAEKPIETPGFKRKLTAILSADVQGYSRLMSDDEDLTISTLTAYRQIVAASINHYRGRVVDSPGDNLLAEFVSVTDAVQCAVKIQEELKDKNTALPERRKMEFRIGINLGDVVEEGERIYGDGVNIAARIESLAEGGGICISGTVYDQIENRLPLAYEFLGEQAVKNIPKSVRVYRIVLAPEFTEAEKSKVKRIY